MHPLERPMYYSMNSDGSTQPVADPRKADWNINHRRVGWDEVNGFDVSTVFLVHDHQYGDGLPLLFETMVFPHGESGDLFCARYHTKAAAEAGHARVVAAVAAGESLDELEVAP